MTTPGAPVGDEVTSPPVNRGDGLHPSYEFWVADLENKFTLASNNPKTHAGVTFEEATPVFFDPYALTHEDRDARSEHRFVTLGMGGKARLLVVVHTFRGETIRIISAWKANLPQRRRYESQF